MTDQQLARLIGPRVLGALQRYGGADQVQLLKDEIETALARVQADPGAPVAAIQAQFLAAVKPIIATVAGRIIAAEVADEFVSDARPDAAERSVH